MQKFLIGGKRVHSLNPRGLPLPSPRAKCWYSRQTIHRDTKYVSRQQSSGKDKLDTSFKVARWGAVEGHHFKPWYIEVRYYERFPTTSPSIFKLGSQVQKENAEGVIARNVPVEVQTFRRSARAAPASVPNQPAPVISLAAEQAAKLDDLPSL